MLIIIYAYSSDINKQDYSVTGDGVNQVNDVIYRGLWTRRMRGKAYEIIKLLSYMNVKWWFNIADSTVYSTLKTLEKKEYILGTAEKVGNMPDRTVYSLSDKGKEEFIATLKASILQFNYDTNIFSIAAFFLNTFTPKEQRELLRERLTVLQKYRAGIEKQVNPLWENEVSATHSANVKRMIDLVDAEITGTKRLLESCNKND